MFQERSTATYVENELMAYTLKYFHEAYLDAGQELCNFNNAIRCLLKHVDGAECHKQVDILADKRSYVACEHQ